MHPGSQGSFYSCLLYTSHLEIPLEEVYGVSTFYSQFTLNPKGKYKISVCLGTACYVKGSGDVFAKLGECLGIQGGECTNDGKFSLEACRCIGACGLAPVMTINDDCLLYTSNREVFYAVLASPFFVGTGNQMLEAVSYTHLDVYKRQDKGGKDFLFAAFAVAIRKSYRY